MPNKVPIFAIHSDTSQGYALKLFWTEAEQIAAMEEMIRLNGWKHSIELLADGQFAEAWSEMCEREAQSHQHYYAHHEIELPPGGPLDKSGYDIAKPDPKSGDVCTQCGGPIDHGEPYTVCDTCREKNG